MQIFFSPSVIFMLKFGGFPPFYINFSCCGDCGLQRAPASPSCLCFWAGVDESAWVVYVCFLSMFWSPGLDSGSLVGGIWGPLRDLSLRGQQDGRPPHLLICSTLDSVLRSLQTESLFCSFQRWPCC